MLRSLITTFEQILDRSTALILVGLVLMVTSAAFGL